MEERIEAAERERVMREKQIHQEERLAKVCTLSSLDESLCVLCAYVTRCAPPSLRRWSG